MPRPLGVYVVLTLAPGCSPWRLQSAHGYPDSRYGQWRPGRDNAASVDCWRLGSLIVGGSWWPGCRPEVIDDLRFVRGVDPDPVAQRETVVRRMKSQITDVEGNSQTSAYHSPVHHRAAIPAIPNGAVVTQGRSPARGASLAGNHGIILNDGRYRSE
jgi:hypothetical protein